MPQAGDTYSVIIQTSHLNWGTHRYTGTRRPIYGEGYIQIPKHIAQNFNIFNSNNPNTNNIYLCSSEDGFFQEVELKAAGSSIAGDRYAKQFQGNGTLQTVGAWYQHVNAQVGDLVHITFTGPHSLMISYEPSPQLNLFQD